jgi:hypothetical protein
MGEQPPRERWARVHDGPVRVVQDLIGSRWRIYEMRPVLDRRQGPVLVFESDDVVRRIRNCPDDWETMADQDLLALVEP